LACPQPQKGAKGAAKRGIAMHTHAMKARATTTKNRGGGKTEEMERGVGAKWLEEAGHPPGSIAGLHNYHATCGSRHGVSEICGQNKTLFNA